MPDPLAFARETARRAGRLLVETFDRQHEVWKKSTDIDLVTEADIAAEQLIVETIQERFPDHAIVAEEGSNGARERFRSDLEGNGGQPVWLVDPLDGTVNYAHGYPVWGVSLALVKAGRVMVATSYDVLRDELYWAERGGGAWCNGRRLHVSAVTRLGDALVATGFAYRRATLEDNNLDEFGRVMPRVQGVRRAGAAVLDLAHVAAGRLDGYWEMHLQPWDWAAGWLLVEEAGGKVTDLDGRPWTLAATRIAASNGPLHDNLLELICGT
jgi:myo-inositol-1(or 4)-monophosphatase